MTTAIFEVTERRGSGRVFTGSGIRPKYGAGIGKTINILEGSGISLLPGKRDSPKFGHGMRDFSHLSVGNLGNGPNRYDKVSNQTS